MAAKTDIFQISDRDMTCSSHAAAAVISVPLSFTATHLSRAQRAIRGAAGMVSMVLGGVIVF